MRSRVFKKIFFLSYALGLSYGIFFPGVAPAELSVASAPSGLFVRALASYFENYYALLKRADPPDPEHVLGQLKEMVFSFQPQGEAGAAITDTQDFFHLSQRLNASRLLRERGLFINLFLDPDAKTVHCWLGRREKEESGVKVIWGRPCAFRLVVIDKLLIHDYLFTATDGAAQLEIGTQEGLIICNREAFVRKAEERWGLLLSRQDPGKGKAYHRSSSDRLRRNLQRRAWEELFFEVAEGEKGEGDRGREKFIASAADKLLEVAVWHEIGHIWADGDAAAVPDEAIHEALALLSELRFGSLPHESLSALVSFAWRSPWRIYREAGQGLLSAIVERAEAGRPRAGLCLKKPLSKRQEFLAHLNASQIQELIHDIDPASCFLGRLGQGAS